MTVNYQTTQPFGLSVAKGSELKGYELVHKFGVNTAVGTSFAPVTLGGVYPTPQSTGAVALRIRAGGNAADDAAGAGAQEVTLYGLGEDFEHASAALATAGASASDPSTVLFTRLPRAVVSKSGTYASAVAGSHAGTIVIEDTAGNEWATILLNGFPHATTNIAVYSVAANEVAYIRHVDIFTDSAKSTEVLLFKRENADELAAPYSPMKVLTNFITQGGADEHDLSHSPIRVEGPADIGFMAKVDVGSAVVSAGFELILQRLRPAAGMTSRESPPGV